MRICSKRSDGVDGFFLLFRLLRKMQLMVCLVACPGALLFSPPAHAENLLEIYKLAIENDPRLLAAERKNLASAQASTQSLGALLPTLAFDYQDIDTNQDIISSSNNSYTTGKLDFPTRSYTLKLTQPIFNYASYARHNQAKAEVKKQRQSSMRKNKT